MFGIHRNFPAGGGGSTGDATAEQWEVVTGKTAYIASGKVTGTGYFPAMMQFDGSTGYYSLSGLTFSGSAFTVKLRFNIASFTGTGTYMRLLQISATGGNRALILVLSSNYTTADWQSKILVQVQNTSGAVICQLISTTSITDGADHLLDFAFDGGAGTAVFKVDLADEDNAGASGRVAPTTGTLPTASATLRLGAGVAAANPTDGKLGFFGYRDAYLTNVSDFAQTDGSPKPLDESTWTEWGGTQPAFWHEAAKLDEHLGSAGAATANGTITLASAIP